MRDILEQKPDLINNVVTIPIFGGDPNTEHTFSGKILHDLSQRTNVRYLSLVKPAEDDKSKENSERQDRTNSLQNPDLNNSSQLFADLKWMLQKGINHDIGILLKARRNPELNQETLQLIDDAVKQIAARDLQQKHKEFAARLEQMKTPLLKESGDNRELLYQEILSYAIEVFETENNAKQWLNSSRQELGGLTPNDILVTEDGCETVKNMLGRVDYGVYA